MALADGVFYEHDRARQGVEQQTERTKGTAAIVGA